MKKWPVMEGSKGLVLRRDPVVLYVQYCSLTVVSGFFGARFFLSFFSHYVTQGSGTRQTKQLLFSER